MEHFWFWGVEEDIRKASPIPAEFGIGGLTAYGTLLGPYAYDWYQRALVRPYSSYSAVASARPTSFPRNLSNV
jgi:hypothetical protein